MISDRMYALRICQYLIGKQTYKQFISRRNKYAHEEDRGQFFDTRFSNIRIIRGMDKIVIVPASRRFVLKIGVRRNNHDGYNTIMKEIDIYECAECLGVEEYFSAPLFDFTYNDIDVFVFEKIDNVGDADSFTVSDWELQENDGIYFETSEQITDKNVRSALDQIFSDWCITDMHEGNYGYDVKRGHIVYIDYGGFEW